MDFEIYCDESGHEALTQKEAHPYVVIGGIWIPADQRHQLKESTPHDRSRIAATLVR